MSPQVKEGFGRRLFALYLAAVGGALVGAFFATPYSEVVEEVDSAGAPGMHGGCCPWPESRNQPGLLHLPRVMRHGESYLVVLITGGKAGLDSLALIGDSVIGETGSWDTVQVPLVHRLEIRASGERFRISQMRPDERRGIVRSKSPELWIWEVYPIDPGRLLLFVSGAAWADSIPFYFDLAYAKVQVHRSWWARFDNFSKTPIAQLLGVALGVPLGGWILDWLRRRRRRPAGYGR